MTLTARTPDGSKPTRDALNQAQQIISARVNGLGVSGSEVVIDGDNLVITVPGTDGNEARNLGQTARLFIRPVIGQPIPIDAIKKPPPGTPGAPPPGGPGGPPAGAPGAPPPPAPPAPPGEAPAAAPPAPASPAPQPRPFPQEPTPEPPAPPSGDAPAPSSAPAPAPSPAPGAPATPGAPAPPGPPGPPDPKQDLAARIKFEKELRQSTNQTLLVFAVQYVAGRCDQEDILAGNDDPDLPLRHYLAPLSTPDERMASWVFPRQIIKSSDWLSSLWQRRSALASKRILLAWGMKDIAFREKELRQWQAAFPAAQTVMFPDTGHFVAEEQAKELAHQISVISA